MHTLHWWAVKAVDKEDAAGIVESVLSEEYVDWSDWYVVGGGRWSNSQYENSHDMVISYDEEPEKFKETIRGCIQARIDEMNYLKDKIDLNKFANSVEKYANFGSIGEDRFGLQNYFVRQAGTMLLEYYNPNSYFYDIIHHSASTDYIYELIDKKDSNGLFLVPVDFHYQKG